MGFGYLKIESFQKRIFDSIFVSWFYI